MRNLTSSLVTLSLAGIIAGGIAVGCSADGGTDIPGDSTGTDTNATDPADSGSGPSTPATDNTGSGSNTGSTGTGGGTTTGKDAGKSGGNTGTDSGVSMGKDAGPPAPNAGDACSALNTTYTRSCGFCGSQSAVCLANGATGKVSDYSPCTNEVVGGCAPGSTTMEACGLCGTHQKVCQNNCQWQAGSCTGEPANACSPGTVTNSGAGCGVGTYRQQTCGVDCKQGNFSATCGSFVNPVILQVPAVGAVVTQHQDLEITAGKTFKLNLASTCPATTVTADLPSDYVELDNNTGKAAKVTIYQSADPAGDASLDTILWVYNGSTPPADDAAKKACVGSVADSCTVALCGASSFGSLSGVAIPAGGKILVYSAGYFSDQTGPMKLNIKTESLN
jgi:hypothetical protein